MSQGAGTAMEATRSVATGRWRLFGDVHLADPELLAILLIVVVSYVVLATVRRPMGRVPSLPTFDPPKTLAQSLAWIPDALTALALIVASFALARPVRTNVVQTSHAEGVDIVLAVDRSSSMQHKDLDPRRTRLEVVKNVVGDFARRRMTDEVGASDNVALLTFAQFPELLCPFTLDVEALDAFLEEVQMVRYRQEDGTAIGVALAKAVAVLAASDAESKVCVLLTDGENNVQEITPLDAAQLARREGVRVYTVLAGRYVYTQDIFGNVRPSNAAIDSTELEAIAEETGGLFFRARDVDALESVYEQIEELERTPREERRHVESYDLYHWLVGAAGLVYLIGWLSRATWARRLA